MADLNARSDSFISLLLDVAGKARPGDLTGMSSSEAAALLQAYAAAHPERGLTYDGSQLTPAAAPAVAPAPAPVAPEPYPAAAPVAAPTPAGWESPVTTPDPYAMPATPAPEPYGAPQPVVPAVDVYGVPAPVPAVDAYGVPVPDAYGAPQPGAAEAYGVPTAAAPVSEPVNPELPSWVYEQPAAAPAPAVEAYPAAAVGAAAVGETPAAAPVPVYQGEAPGTDFEEQLLADIDDGLPPMPEPVKEKRAATSVSPVIWIALAVVVLAAVAVVALDYFGIVSILGLNPQASTPTPAPAPSALPPGVPTSTPEVTSSVPSSPTP